MPDLTATAKVSGGYGTGTIDKSFKDDSSQQSLVLFTYNCNTKPSGVNGDLGNDPIRPLLYRFSSNGKLHDRVIGEPMQLFSAGRVTPPPVKVTPKATKSTPVAPKGTTAPAPGKGETSTEEGEPETDESANKRFPWWWVVAAIVAALIVIALVYVFCFCLPKRRRHSEPRRTKSRTVVHHTPPPPRPAPVERPQPPKPKPVQRPPVPPPAPPPPPAAKTAPSDGKYLYVPKNNYIDMHQPTTIYK